MATIARSRRARSPLAWALALASVLLLPGAVRAQIVVDGTLTGSGQTALTGPSFAIGANLGVVQGSNLFHSFHQFNLASGQTAVFSGPAGTANVISRVTGGQGSTIDGTIQSTMAGASFYFFNPQGVAFGPNARLNVSGSFHVSTADYLGFLGGDRFVAQPVPIGQNLVLTGSPASFGFLGPTPAPISIQGSTVAPILQVPASTTALARTLSIVGGDITIKGPAPLNSGTLLARGGLVQVVSVRSAGEATLSAAGQTPDVSVSSFSALGDIKLENAPTIALANNAVIDAGGRVAATLQPSGTVLIRGGRLQIDSSSVLSNTTGGVNASPVGAARAVDIRLAGDMSLAGNSRINAQTAGLPVATFRGQGGEIVAEVASLSLTGGSQIARTSNSSSTALTGGIRITASDSITIDGVSATGASSGLFSTPARIESFGGVTITGGASLTLGDRGTILSQPSAQGSAGDVTLTVGSLTATGGANISTGASAQAPAGRITVTADAVSLSGRNPGDPTKPSGILSTSGPTAVSGDISVSAASVSVTDGAAIQSGSATSGQGGSVTVLSTGPVVVASEGAITSQTRGGDVREVKITAPSLALDNGRVQATTNEAGKAGDVTVAVGTLSVRGGGQIKTSSEQTATGAAGSITVTASESATVSGPGSGLFSTADEFGKPGRIEIVTPALGLGDGGQISVTTNTRVASAPPGDITLSVGTLGLGGGAHIDSGTTGAAQGGNVTVAAGSSVTVSGSAISSNATSTGAGGNITIRTPQMALTDHATLSARSTGTGDAGSIALVLGESLRIQDSAITTAATQADGGNVSITTTGSLLYMLNGRITTSVGSGLGGGGNIAIGSLAHPVEFVILNSSEIRADAFGGPGGNIDIFAGTYLTSDTVLSASSALGVPGTIGIQAGITDVSGSVGQLPEAVLQAATLLRAACAARLAGGQSSSLVVSGREGLPAEPGGALPSPVLADGPAESGSAMDEGRGGADELPRIALWAPAPRCLR
jgi:filamentous hemagglutinin family protein